MKKIKILSGCVCSGRNLEAGTMLDLDALKAADIAVLTGAGLARIVDRYEIPENDLKPVNVDPRPEKREVKTKKRKRKRK